MLSYIITTYKTQDQNTVTPTQLPRLSWLQVSLKTTAVNNAMHHAQTAAASPENARWCVQVIIGLYELNLLELPPVKTPSHIYIEAFH